MHGGTRCRRETFIRGLKNRLSQRSFELKSLVNVGSYGITPVWGDGHRTGIYSFEYLARLVKA